MDKPIVVIGAGFSGMAAIKSCLESGLKVISFEKLNTPGGLWRFREDDLSGVASVMRSTIINTSKEMNAFSDFVPAKELPNYMHNSKMLQYFDSYVEHFQLLPHVKFAHEVVSAQQAANFSHTGQWKLIVKNLKTIEESEITAAGLMVCTGHHVFPSVPTFPGLNAFAGRILHSHSYKDFQGFQGRRIVIIGVGNSGVDVAVELSRVASQVYLSSRRGAWIQNRVGETGNPRDLQSRRSIFNNSLFQHLPQSLSTNMAIKQINARIDHTKYNLQPNHSPFQAHPTVSDELPNRIISGTVIIKKDVHKFSKHGVYFQEEEDIEHLIDVVVLATGYTIRFPFLSEHILPIHNNQVHLFKHVFLPELHPPTLAIIGLVQPIGSLVPISEMQSRLAVQVFLHKIKLPTSEEMLLDVHNIEKALRNRYVQSSRHTIQVDYQPYMDELAHILGVKPNLFQLFFKDPKLWAAITFGPVVAYQYRLQGPHVWQGARAAILTLWDRVYFPLNPKYHKGNDKNLSRMLLVFLLFCIIFAYFLK